MGAYRREAEIARNTIFAGPRLAGASGISRTATDYSEIRRISETAPEKFSLAAVKDWTSAGEKPGATSRRTRPCGATSITARSVTIVLTHSRAVSGNVQRSTIFG